MKGAHVLAMLGLEIHPSISHEQKRFLFTNKCESSKFDLSILISFVC
jgi:hypothetical protein